MIVALDVASGAEAMRLATLLAPVTRFFKIGSYLFTLEGPKLIEQLAGCGFRIFLDLKFHDIPQVVAGAVRNGARLGASMMTLHASGGEPMLQAAVTAVGELPGPARPVLLGVTVLTSFSEEMWGQTFPRDSIDQAVGRLAAIAQSAGLDGLVCSPQDLKGLSRVPLRKVVPGIRPADSGSDDQRRTMTPAGAIAAGADYLVVGRPITRSPDPLQAARRILREIGPGKEKQD